MDKYTSQQKIGTAQVKTTETHLHIMQNDEITGALNWGAFEAKDVKALINFIQDGFSER